MKCDICGVKYKGYHVGYCKTSTIRYFIDSGYSFSDLKNMFPINKEIYKKIDMLYGVKKL